MAYNLKYYGTFNDFSGNTFTVNLLKNNYTGSTYQIATENIKELNVVYRGTSQRGESDSIRPSESNLNFYCRETENYDDLFTSNYKDFQLQILKGGSLYWQGYVKPENLSKTILVPKYFIQINAIDGLLDLKDIDFPLSGATGYTSYISTFKTILSKINIPLDIEAQLNTYEKNLMTSSQSFLSYVQANLLRFIDSTDGRTKALKCYDALNYLLTICNAKIFQSGGKYVVLNEREINSYKQSYNWSSLSLTRTSFDRTLNITAYGAIQNSDNLTKLTPLKKVELTYRNKNVNQNVISNGTFNSDISGWSNGSGSNAFYTALFAASPYNGSGSFWVANASPLRNPNYSGGYYIESPTFYLTSSGGVNDYLSVTLNAYSTFTFTGSTNFPIIEVDIVYPDSSIHTSSLSMIGGNKLYDFGQYSFNINQTGNYKLRVWVKPSSYGSYMSAYGIWFDNISVLTKYENDTTTYDTYQNGILTGSTAVEIEQDTIYFNDGLITNAIGNLKIGTTLTSSWNSYGNTESLSISNLLIQQRLKSNQRFRDFLTLTIRHANNIVFNNAIQINSTLYNITGYNNDIRNNKVQLELEEFISTNVLPVYDSTVLSTVDGQSSSTTIKNSGSEISDTTTGSLTTWSSSKINTTFNGETLQQVMSRGNTTTQTILLKDAGNTKTVSIKVDSSGNLLFSGATNTSAYFTGDVQAFSNLSGGLPTWFSLLPTASTSQFGMVKIGSGLNVASGVVSNPYTSGSLTGILKGNGSGGFSLATTGDYPTFNQNTTGTASNITAYSINQNLSTSSAPSFDKLTLTNNGNGTNLYLGDDAKMGDVNIANTTSLTGQQDATKGYIIFGNYDNTSLGRSGSGALTYGGNTIYHSGNFVAGSQFLAPNGSAAALTSFPTLNQNTTGNAATATLATNFSGSLAGDISGGQSSTVLATVNSNTGVYSYPTMNVDGKGRITSISSNTPIVSAAGTTDQILVNGSTSSTTGAITLSLGRTVFTSPCASTSNAMFRAISDNGSFYFYKLGTNYSSVYGNYLYELDGDSIITNTNTGNILMFNNNASGSIKLGTGNRNYEDFKLEYTGRLGLGLSGVTASQRLDINGNFILSGNHQRKTNYTGHLEGGYNNVGANDTNTNPIYTIGSSYNPNSTTLGSMYGIGYTYGGNASFLNSTFGGGWGLYVAANGTARVFLDADNGNIKCTNAITSGGLVTAGGLITGQGLAINKTSGIGRLNFNTSGNDPAFIEHDESTVNTGIMRFSCGDDNDTTDKFSFGNTAGGTYAERLYINANGNLNTSGTITATGNIYSYGETTAFSDARLKDNVNNYAGGLDKVLALNPVTYTLKNDDSKKTHLGVIAQEVDSIEGLLVENTSTGYKAVNYAKMNILLINAIKELNEKLSSMQIELDNLKSKKKGK